MTGDKPSRRDALALGAMAAAGALAASGLPARATPERRDAAIRAFAGEAAIRPGRVTVDIGQRFALADARAAHGAIESRKTTGSTVLIP